MSNTKFYTWNGQTKTLRQWAEILGISRNTLRLRMKMNMEPRHIFSPLLHPNRRKDPKPKAKQLSARIYTYKGMSGTLSEWSDLLDVHVDTLRSRIRFGNPPEKVFIGSARAPKKYRHDGKTLTLAEWSRELDRPLQTLVYRLRVGMPLDEVFTPRKHACSTRRAKRITYQGRTMTLKRWAAVLGVSYATLYQRMRKGLPIEEVLSYGNMPRKPIRSFEVNGVSRTLTEWAASIGITYHALTHRLRRGMTLAEAIEQGNSRRGRKRRLSSTVSGQSLAIREGEGSKLRPMTQGPARDRNNRVHSNGNFQEAAE